MIWPDPENEVFIVTFSNFALLRQLEPRGDLPPVAEAVLGPWSDPTVMKIEYAADFLLARL